MNVLNIWKSKEQKFNKDEINFLFLDNYLKRGDVGHVIFALPWFITWYSHVLEDLDVILRLYDLFIVSHYLMPIYVAAEVGRIEFCFEEKYSCVSCFA